MIERTVVATSPPEYVVRDFGRWVAECTPRQASVLNIGAGANISGSLEQVRRRSGHLVGVDPDPSVHTNQDLDEAHEATLETFAIDHAEEFDTAFSVFVLEHVADPVEFTESCAQVLKPGGSLFGLTVNKYQYFGLSTWAATRLGVSDWMLQRLKAREVIDTYHFPTEYRINSIRRITWHLDAAGFSSVEFRCYEKTAMYEWYLPRGARWFAGAYTKAAYGVGVPHLMGHITFRAIR
jgi:SAM-dependent methyltransferase